MSGSIKSAIANARRIALPVAALSTWAAPAIGGATVGQVPEPATLLMLAVGVVALWWGQTNRKP